MDNPEKRRCRKCKHAVKLHYTSAEPGTALAASTNFTFQENGKDVWCDHCPNPNCNAVLNGETTELVH